MTRLNSLYRVADRIVFWTTAVLTGGVLLSMSVLVVWMVVARYALDAPIFWGEETARLMMFFLVLIGGALALRLDHHPRLTLFADMLPRAARQALRFAVDVLVFGTLVVLLVHGAALAFDEAIMRTPSLRISYFWIYLAYPLGAVLALFQVVGRRAGAELPAGFDHEGDA
ncbi:TRAP transporter small permease [Azospirillum sp. ST 5-10]|uniref:TRAP transporter small permease n=1 Tax=unclassified Azospirillum TaxID=2630922 RepID=UPI003F4A745A